MNYKSTIEWLFRKLPVYQNSGNFKYKLDLESIHDLSNYLGNPHNQFKTIHVAGTNGKGSTSHIISSILQESGYKVGLYTSPHLKDFRERIKINGVFIPKEDVVQFITHHKEYLELNMLSFFEMTVGMAFDYFEKKNVDVAIIEVGMGGRLDSTNIIDPEISIITNIGLDHTKFLGNTLREIALEKAGIIKLGKTIVIGESQTEIADIFIERAKTLKSNIIFADQQKKIELSTDLKGSYQRKNIQTAMSVIDELQKYNWDINEDSIKSGLLNVQLNTSFTGRWTIINKSPLTICDTAHNIEGLSIVLKDLLLIDYSKLHFVIGFVEDKDLSSIVDLFPVDANYYFCKPSISRGLDAEKLKDIFMNNNRAGRVYSSVEKAYSASVSIAKKDDIIYIGGSTFVVAEIL